jgi:hypothetical protein
MSISQEIINEMKQDLERKKKAREGVLDRLAIVDIELDQLTGVIKGLDSAALPFINNINQVVPSIQAAYDARIAADCRTDLIWEEGKPFTRFVTSGAGDGASMSEVTFTPYTVVKNKNTADFEPFQGIKYYSKPSQRDYGSSLVAEFDALVSEGSKIVGIVGVDGEPVTSVPSEIQINDTLINSFDNPTVFTTGDLPEVTGFGTTEIVGIVTTLICGIDTGSNILRNFGAGDISSVEVGMVVMDPAVTGNDPSFSGVLSSDGWTTITGFGTANQIIEYYDSVGILTTSTLEVPTLILDKPAQNYLEEGTFRVGILTEVPALFISTSALASYGSTQMYVIRNDRDIDAGFDYLKSPNNPVKIGIIGSGDVGIGNSVFYDDSGDPNETKRYNSNKTVINPLLKTRNDCLFKNDGTPRKNATWNPETKECTLRDEPAVGAGRVSYNVGTTQWPTLTVCTQSGGGGGSTVTICTTTYPPEGTVVTIGGTAGPTISYASTGPSGKNPSGAACQALDAAIASAESNLDNTISQNRPQAEALVNRSEVMRNRRSEKELYAWSLLVSAARLREEIDLLTKQISEVESFDYTPYEKK